MDEPNRQDTAADDSLLASLLESLLDADANDAAAALEQSCREYPELATELRSLMAMSHMADDLGRDVSTVIEEAVPPASRSNSPQPIGHIAGYELKREIGRGGMGVVYEAEQRSLGRTVALKMILRGSWASLDDVNRFRREARLAAAVNHPHLLPVFDVGEQDGQWFFTMPLVEGTTLAKRIAEGPVAPRQAAALLLPICEAVAAAHAQGLLHRDLKPSNILLDADGRPFVTDFGLAKPLESDPADSGTNALESRAHSITASGAILGTPAYMAPEQAAGQHKTVGPAADIYGLGAILYATLTGRAPFQSASPLDTMLMVLEQDPVPPRFLNPSADSDLEMITLKCLQKPIDLRYATVEQLVADLRAFVAGDQISARSGRFSQIISRAFRETHHAGLLENWGLLWMWHSLVLFVLCLLTNWFQWRGIAERWPYVVAWTLGLTVWASIFWNLRLRAGPITFVERQIAHVWAGSMIASSLLYAVEWRLGLPVLQLSPVLALIAAMVFLVKAGMLSGGFYPQTLALLVTAIVMAESPTLWGRSIGLSLFGVVSALCFFLPGLKYYRQRTRQSVRQDA